MSDLDTPAGYSNGHDEVTLHDCRYGCDARFTTLNARLEHEPSCRRNPARVAERDNPERDR